MIEEDNVILYYVKLFEAGTTKSKKATRKMESATKCLFLTPWFDILLLACQALYTNDNKGTHALIINEWSGRSHLWWDE